MKKVACIALLVAAVGVQFATPKALAARIAHYVAASFKWERTDVDLGKVKQNIPVNVSYTFVNNGSEPLVITDVKASCGCTGTEYPKTPVMPGEKATVKATFNAASLGMFSKTVTVMSNAPEGNTVLTFKGEVVQ